MAKNNYDYLNILEEYALPKLDEYSKIVEHLLAKRIVAVTGSFYEKELKKQRQVNEEMYNKLKAGSLEALVILEGNKEKFEVCLDLALSRNSTECLQGPYAVLTSINVDGFCSDIKNLSYLVEQKDTEDYSNEPSRAFDKVMEKSGFEVREPEPDKLPPKRKK